MAQDLREVRKEFIGKIPGTIINTLEKATSTLECDCDSWGKCPTHYRWVNIRNEDGNLIPQSDDPERYQKELRLIGQPHVQWDGPYVLVRMDKDHGQWFKHWSAAIQLYLFGKLDRKHLPWVIEEGATRWVNGQISIKNSSGKLTQAVQALLRLKILVERKGQIILAIEADKLDQIDAVAAIVNTEKVVPA